MGAAGGGGGFALGGGVVGGGGGEEGVLFAGVGDGFGLFLLFVFLRVEGVVVDALGDQGAVGEAEVDCEGDDGGHETGPEAAREGEDVAGGPDEEEGHGNAICVAVGVVLDQLRDEQEDPGGEGDGAQDAAEGFGGGERGGGMCYCLRQGGEDGRMHCCGIAGDDAPVSGGVVVVVVVVVVVLYVREVSLSSHKNRRSIFFFLFLLFPQHRADRNSTQAANAREQDQQQASNGLNGLTEICPKPCPR